MLPGTRAAAGGGPVASWVQEEETVRFGLKGRATRGETRHRRALQGAVAIGAATALVVGGLPAAAQDSSAELRAELLKIPGVGAGSPTDADWQRVGELTLGPTRANVAEGECAGVNLTFLGLNNQGLHNFLFRGFLRAWVDYTGANIEWIDLAQADYNGRLQQAIATGTVDFDILAMGSPFEGDTAGRGLLDPMPDWVKEQIDIDDYVDYLKPPVGTWGGETYRISIDGDTHTLAYRTDYYADAALAEAWTAEGHAGEWAPPTTWEQVNEQSKFLAGKKDPLTGLDAHGVVDPLNYLWGGFGLYFLTDRAVAYAKHPDSPAFLFDPADMRPLINTPGWVQAIQDVIDLKDTPGAYPADQLSKDPNGTGFDQFLAGTGAAVMWWGDVGSNARTSDTSVVGPVVGFDINPGADRVYNWMTEAWEETPNRAPSNAYIGWGIYVTNQVSGDELKRKCAWSAAAHLGGKDLSLWTVAYPSGYQPYRNSHFNYDEWEAAGYDREFIEDYLSSNLDSYNHPNAANEPRIPGIFQYYSRAEDILVNGLGSGATAQEIADEIAAAWEETTDQIGRESQLELYRASLGLSD
ncbi:MAG: extracellular solute-binding protein [Chloroflexi bacterium]|nr:extracellular solute-binding protein [Chloroflexota bacterium]